MQIKHLKLNNFCGFLDQRHLIMISSKKQKSRVQTKLESPL